MTKRRELLLGAGSKRDKHLGIGSDGNVWHDLTTLDSNEDHHPDVVHDLNQKPWPFPDESFDEIHAYEVLEHLASQGDWKSFFDEWTEMHRILKPDGIVFGSVPSWKSVWAWGDPSHTRIITAETLTFLNQEQYEDQVGRTPMSDFRFYFKVSFEPVYLQEDGDHLWFGMKKA